MGKLIFFLEADLRIDPEDIPGAVVAEQLGIALTAGLVWPIVLVVGVGAFVWDFMVKLWNIWCHVGLSHYLRAAKRRRIKRTNWIDGN